VCRSERTWRAPPDKLAVVPTSGCPVRRSSTRLTLSTTELSNFLSCRHRLALGDAWREAEEIAAIADGMFVPEELAVRVGALKEPEPNR
jgi:hypothetical protein